MKLIICDPCLDNLNGHHYDFDATIAREAEARGIPVSIFCHRAFPVQFSKGLSLQPMFSSTAYGSISADAISGAYDNFIHFNDAVLRDLEQLPVEALDPDTVVLFPTVTENHLYGILRWIQRIPVDISARFVVFLMLPSGICLTGEDGSGADVEVLQPFQALFYRLCFREAARVGSGRLAFYASSEAHAAEFSRVAGSRILAHPVIVGHTASLPLSREHAHPRVLLFAGDAKETKGFFLLREVAERLASERPDLEVVLHFNCGEFSAASVRAEAEQLHALAQRTKTVELHTGFLALERYTGLLHGADLLVAPYDPVTYRAKSSGIAWEALRLGKPIVVPEGTWLERECRRVGGVVRTFSEFNAERVTDAIVSFLPDLAAAGESAATIGARFRAANTPKALLDQVLSDALGHLFTSSLCGVVEPRRVPVERLEGVGWHPVEQLDGRSVRWMGRSGAFSAGVSSDGAGWLRIHGPAHAGRGALSSLHVCANGYPLGGAVVRLGHKAWMYVCEIPESLRERMQPVLFELEVTETVSEVASGRELSVLVAGVEFLRDQSDATRVPSEYLSEHAPVMLTNGRCVEDRAAEGYRMGAWATGECWWKGNGSAVLECWVRESVLPDLPHRLLCMVNGERVAGVCTRHAVAGWSLRYAVPQQLLRGVAPSVAVDFLLEDTHGLQERYGWELLRISVPYLRSMS